MIQMNLAGLGFDPKNMSPIVLLRDSEDRNFLPIWIGMFEAASIAMELQEFKPPRPMTHDLCTIIMSLLKAKVKRVLITDIIDNTFFATIELINSDNEILKIDARPSDAVAIAARTHAPIYVSEAVMTKAKMINPEKDAEETKRFKEFIDNIQPNDFSKYIDNR